MTFIGFSTTIQSEKGDVTCPEFWEKEYTQKYARLWQTIQKETPGEKAILENGIGMFALCDDKHSSLKGPPGSLQKLNTFIRAATKHRKQRGNRICRNAAGYFIKHTRVQA